MSLPSLQLVTRRSRDTLPFAELGGGGRGGTTLEKMRASAWRGQCPRSPCGESLPADRSFVAPAGPGEDMQLARLCPPPFGPAWTARARHPTGPRQRIFARLAFQPEAWRGGGELSARPDSPCSTLPKSPGLRSLHSNPGKPPPPSPSPLVPGLPRFLKRSLPPGRSSRKQPGGFP